MIADAAGSTIQHHYIKPLAYMLAPRPPIFETLDVVQRAGAMEQRIQLEAQSSLRLGVLKAGRADGLLTGRVPVNPLLDAAAHS